MRRTTGILVTATLLEVLSSPAARADVPSAGTSTVPHCFVGCPAGDVAFTVIVRDAANNPKPFVTVTLDFSTCPAVAFCGVQEAGTTVSGSIASRVNDATGTATFHLRIGGLCPSGHVRVLADGVFLADGPVANLDQNGDLQVNAADQSTASAKVGTSDLSADFDCSGAVDQADRSLLASHVGHVCDATTPVAPRTWGELKVIYR